MPLNPSCASHPNSPFLLWSHWHLEGLGCQQGPVKRKKTEFCILCIPFTFVLLIPGHHLQFPLKYRTNRKLQVWVSTVMSHCTAITTNTTHKAALALPCRQEGE